MASNDPEMLVTWDDEYRFGLPEIDKQHEFLFGLMNRIWSAMNRQADQQEVLALVGELETYTVTHFSDEERYMRETHYPRFDDHKKAHDAFVVRLAKEKQAILGGHPLSDAMMTFLKDWLISHILVLDRDYAAHAGHHLPSTEVFAESFYIG